jgi:predicted SnoaL-like aldol condensation-catalyzing enzyme
VTIGAIDIARLEGGKIVEHWGQMDTYGLLQQLEASGVWDKWLGHKINFRS